MNRFCFGLGLFATEITDHASVPHRSISGLCVLVSVTTVLVSVTTVLVCGINVLVSVIFAFATNYCVGFNFGRFFFNFSCFCNKNDGFSFRLTTFASVCKGGLTYIQLRQ